MKILVNGVNLKVGGGVTVIMNFLKTIIENKEFHNHEYHVLVPSGVGYEGFDKSPVKVEIIPDAMKSPLKRLLLDYTWFNSKIKKVNPDVIFTMGNIAIPSKLKQVVLFMYPYAIYPEDDKVWDILTIKTRIDLRLRNRLFKNRLKYANIILPQTETAKLRLEEYYGDRIKNIKVIPTAYSRIGDKVLGKSFFKKEVGIKYLFSLTKYYPHKNLEIFIPLAKLIKNFKAPFKIVTTVEGNQGPGSQEFLDDIKNNNLSDIIINIGKIPMEAVPSLYEDVDGLILPTLLESFSATYVDSMTLGVPVFTSDRDFAKDVCGDAAFYFDPFDAENIYKTINNAFESEAVIQNAIIKGEKRASRMPDWYEVTKMYTQTLKELNES